MFTINEITSAREKVRTSADYSQFVRTLATLGVVRYDVYVINGMATYFGSGDETLQGAPAYEDFLIEEKSSVEELKKALKSYHEGGVDYETFCREAATAGIEKWVVNLNEMTITYLDEAGTQLLVEKI